MGSLARKHKLQVYFRPSSRGGTGVVMRIPQQLVIHPREEAPAPARTDTRTAGSVRAGGDTTTRAPAATAVLDAALPGPAEELPELPELPKRPRGQTLAAAVRDTEAKRKPVARTEKRTDIGARFSAFQQGRRSTTPDQSAGEEDSL